jgi:hypothetical protein
MAGEEVEVESGDMPTRASAAGVEDDGAVDLALAMQSASRWFRLNSGRSGGVEGV